MTGLDLAGFLRLLRLDAALWASLAVIVLILALMAWTSFGRKRTLRKCLVVSLLVKPIGARVHGKAGTVRRDIVRCLVIGSVPAAFLGAMIVGLWLDTGDSLEVKPRR